jgi:hypothetical protein
MLAIKINKFDFLFKQFNPMNKYKVYAVVLAFLSFGSIQETLRILTSSDADIVESRSALIPISVILTGLLVFFSIKFWIKSSNTPKL